MTPLLKEVRNMLRPHKQQRKDRIFLGTGSTLLNLACSGKVGGGFPCGEYVLFVGDTDSGKTWICLNCFAEAAKDRRFEKYRFVYDAPEGGAMMNIREHFGKAVANRLESPRKDKHGNPIHSDTLESFYYHIDDAIKDGRPFIYVLDSVDSLDTKADEKKFIAAKSAYRKIQEKGEGKEEKGSYGTAKAKINSEYVRKLPYRLKKTGSILIIINQTRININAGPFGDPRTRAGGRALEFFACMQLWSSVRYKEKVKISEKKKLQTGIKCRVQVRRSRVTGKDRAVEFPIYHTTGIDDVGSMVDFLCDWGHWDVSKKVISVPEFKVNLKREELIQLIEDSFEKDLRLLVQDVWEGIEGKAAAKRKRRYE